MWNLFNCYLSGRHDYGMWCEPGAIFLRCVHCGKRSPGWAVEGRGHAPDAVGNVPPPAPLVKPPLSPAARVLPFGRATAAR